jgi:hypothetical protein
MIIRTITMAALLLSASIWIGSMVCLAVVARSAGRLLAPGDRVALFADVGRTYRVLGTTSLLVATATGVALAGEPADWDLATRVAIGLVVLLVGLSVAGMRQAHRITGLRRSAAGGMPTTELRTAARNATALRSSMGVVSVVIVVLVCGALSS